MLGSRYVPGGGVSAGGWCGGLRRCGSLYAQILLGVPVRDLTGGFKCFRRRVLEAIDLDGVAADGYGFQIEMTYRAVQAGFRVVEVPIVFRDRRVGTVEDVGPDRARGGVEGACASRYARPKLYFLKYRPRGAQVAAD